MQGAGYSSRRLLARYNRRLFMLLAIAKIAIKPGQDYLPPTMTLTIIACEAVAL
jgi:hypothetical protein